MIGLEVSHLSLRPMIEGKGFGVMRTPIRFSLGNYFRFQRYFCFLNIHHFSPLLRKSGLYTRNSTFCSTLICFLCFFTFHPSNISLFSLGCSANQVRLNKVSTYHVSLSHCCDVCRTSVCQRSWSLRLTHICLRAFMICVHLEWFGWARKHLALFVWDSPPPLYLSVNWWLTRRRLSACCVPSARIRDVKFLHWCMLFENVVLCSTFFCIVHWFD